MTTATAAVYLVKDEADVIEATLRHMADEVDFMIVADNGSTDGTRGILDRLAGELQLIVLNDPDPAYYQSRKMSMLAELAARIGADWIVPADADELWFAHADRVGMVLAGLPSDVTWAYAALTNHLRTGCDEPVLDPFRSMVWRQRDPMPLPKVAFRWEPGAVIHQGNHGVTLPSGGGFAKPVLEIRHFPVRSAEQFTRKGRNGAAAYAATDLPWSEGQHWRSYGLLLEREGSTALNRVYYDHWFYRSPTDSGLIRDPAPYRRWAVEKPTSGEDQE